MRSLNHRLIASGALSLLLFFYITSDLHADLWDESCITLNPEENAEHKTLSITYFGDVNPEMHRQLTTIWDLTAFSYPDIETVKLNLSSHGGSIDSGVAIRNYLLGLQEQHGIKVIAHNVGYVMSAAIDIFCAASERYASPHTVFLIHHAQGDIYDSEWDDLDNLVEQRQQEIHNSLDMFKACTGMDADKAGRLFADETTFGPDQAVEYGLIQEIVRATYDQSVDISCKLEMTESY